jgi:general secretion pathway protein K
MLATRFKKIKGSALITALFIMTLVAIAATAMSIRMRLDIYRTQLTITNDKLYLASEAVTFWAMDILSRKKQTFSANMNFPVNLETIYPNVSIKGNLYDLHALFNLNNLLDKKFFPLFYKLLENNLEKTDDSERKALLQAIHYWISSYQPGRGHDEYLAFYSKQKPAYLPGYQRMQSISELRLVRGVDQATYTTLLNHLTVLPEATAININTAPKSLLMILGNGLTESEANEIIQMRGENGITGLQELYPILEKFNIPNNQIALDSTYYLCVATVTMEHFTLKRYTVLKRAKDANGQITVGVVRESLNTI